MTPKQQELVTTQELVSIEAFIRFRRGFSGCPVQVHNTIARDYVANMVYNMTTPQMLLDQLATDISLKRISSWERWWEMPTESTFSSIIAEMQGV